MFFKAGKFFFKSVSLWTGVSKGKFPDSYNLNIFNSQNTPLASKAYPLTRFLVSNILPFMALALCGQYSKKVEILNDYP